MNYALAISSDLFSASGKVPVSDAAPLPVKLLPNLYDDSGAPCAVRRAFANVPADSTDAELVAAVPGKRIRVVALLVLCGDTAANLTFTSTSPDAATAISPQFANAAHSGFVLPVNPFGWIETEVGEALAVTTGPGADSAILIMYVEV